MVSKTWLSLSWRRYATAESIWSTSIQILPCRTWIPGKTYSSRSTSSAFHPFDPRTSPSGHRVITLRAATAQVEGDTSGSILDIRSHDKSGSWPDDWYRLALPDSSLCQCFSNAIHLAAATFNATRYCSGAPLWCSLSHCIFYSWYTLEALFKSHWQGQYF